MSTLPTKPGLDAVCSIDNARAQGADEVLLASRDLRPYEPPEEDDDVHDTTLLTQDEEAEAEAWIARQLRTRAEAQAYLRQLEADFAAEEDAKASLGDQPPPKAGSAHAPAEAAHKIDLRKQLPYCDDHLFAYPNFLGRCALSTLSLAERPRIKGQIAAQKGIVVAYEGVQLDQSDISVLLMLFYLGRGRQAVTGADGVGIIKITFQQVTMLRMLKREGKRARDGLTACLNRLMAGIVTVEITATKQFSAQHLVTNWSRDGASKMYTVNVNAKLLPLFAVGYARVWWDKRLALRRHPLAQWLQMYVATHTQLLPIKVGQIKDLCGSQAKDMREFRRSLKDAIQALKDVGEIAAESGITKNGFVRMVRIDVDKQRPAPERTVKRRSNAAKTQPPGPAADLRAAPADVT